MILGLEYSGLLRADGTGRHSEVPLSRLGYTLYSGRRPRLLAARARALHLLRTDPASKGDEIRPASPVTVIGHLRGDPKAFRHVRDGARVVIARREESR